MSGANVFVLAEAIRCYTFHGIIRTNVQAFSGIGHCSLVSYGPGASINPSM